MIKIKPFRNNHGAQLSEDVDITDVESEKYVNPEIAKKAIDIEKDLHLFVLLEDGPKFNFTRSISGEFDETSIKEFKDNIKQFMSWLIKQELPAQQECLDEQNGPSKSEIAFVKDLLEPDMRDIQFLICCERNYTTGHIIPKTLERMVNAYLEKYGKD